MIVSKSVLLLMMGLSISSHEDTDPTRVVWKPHPLTEKQAKDRPHQLGATDYLISMI